MEQNTGCLSTALLQDGWDQRSHHSVGPGVQLGPNSAVGHGDTPIAGWFLMEDPLQTDDLEISHFKKHPYKAHIILCPVPSRTTATFISPKILTPSPSHKFTYELALTPKGFGRYIPLYTGLT